MRHIKMVLVSNRGKAFRTFIVYSTSQKALLVYLDNVHGTSYSAVYL